MRWLCPTRLLLAATLASLVLGCGVFDSPPASTPTPSAAQSLGLEITETYGKVMLHARIIVDLRPPAPQAGELLRVLRDEFKAQFGNYACLRDALSAAEQADVAQTFDANRERFLPPDMSWFEDAVSDYDLEDATIRGLLEDIRSLDDYAFLDRLTTARPGETVLCEG
jgi:hypothetical protein